MEETLDHMIGVGFQGDVLRDFLFRDAMNRLDNADPMNSGRVSNCMLKWLKHVVPTREAILNAECNSDSSVS